MDQTDYEEESIREYVKIYISSAEYNSYASGKNMCNGADAVLKANHIIELGVSSQDPLKQISHVFAVCLRSSNVANTPHKINIITNKEFTKWNINCSCIAGKGEKCKHIYAVLTKIYKEEALKILTCTDISQKWGKIAKKYNDEHYKFLEASNFCKVKNSRQYISNLKTTPLIAEAKQQNFQSLLEDQSSLHYIAHTAHNDLSKRPKLLRVVKNTERLDGLIKNLLRTTDLDLEQLDFGDQIKLEDFYKNKVCISFEKAVEICSMTVEQNNTCWRTERSKRITASDFYGLTTYISSNSKKKNWTKKIDDYYKPKPDIRQFQHGRRYEPKARELYEIQTGTKVVRLGFLIQPSAPWLGVSLDGYCLKKKKSNRN